jgi:hypothetical protein
MGKIIRQTKSELKQLPLTLSKLLGGIMAVVGLSAAVFLATRTPHPASGGLVLFALLGICGIAVFILSSRALAKRKTDDMSLSPDAKDSVRVSVLSWILLLAFVALFLVVVMFVTR